MGSGGVLSSLNGAPSNLVNTRIGRTLLLAVSALASAAFGSLARATPEEVIARARAYLGGDEALNAVNSLRFIGKYQSEMNGEVRSGTIEMVFQKPYFHRAVIRTDTSVEITGLDDYESWLRVEDPNDATRWRLTNFGREQTKGLRANTWESLSFYAGIERRGGSVTNLGEATIDNILCDKLAFEHDESIVFHRYFEKETGRLILTETAQGSTREQGSQVVNGIRFPETLVSVVRMDGVERTVTLTFTSITVNERYPASLFRVPSVPVPSAFQRQLAPAAPTAPVSVGTP